MNENSNIYIFKIEAYISFTEYITIILYIFHIVKAQFSFTAASFLLQ